MAVGKSQIQKAVMEVVAIRGKWTMPFECPEHKNAQGIEQGKGKDCKYNYRGVG